MRRPGSSPIRMSGLRYQEAQKLIAADSPVIVVDHETQIVAMSKKIQGFTHPTGVFRFRKVTLGD